MLTASIVLYHHSPTEVSDIINCVLKSSVSTLFIVDNSTNDVSRKLENVSDRIWYIHSANLGYGAGHNIAIRKAIEQGADYHVLLNPDIYFGEGTLEKLEAYMEVHSEVGQIMPKVFYPNGELQYLCKLVPSPLDLIFKRFLPSFLTNKKLYKFQLRFSGYDKIMNIPYLSGCFMFFRISVLQQIGLFDERFFMYPEDIDITRRIHEKYKTIFYPDVSIIHAHAAASRSNAKMLKIHIINIIKYFNKWGWFFDSKRRRINKQVLKELKSHE